MGTTLSWELYIRRRKHKPGLYVKNTGITVYEKFVNYMRAKGIGPPTEAQFNSYVENVPSPPVVASVNKEKPTSATSKPPSSVAHPPKIPKKSKQRPKTKDTKPRTEPAKSSAAAVKQTVASSIPLKWKDYLRQAKLSASAVVENNRLTTYKKFQEFLTSNSIEDVPFNAYNSYIFTITQQQTLKKKESAAKKSSHSHKKTRSGNKK